MGTRQPIGEHIDAAGVMATMEDGDLLSDAIVVMRVIRADGVTAVRMAWSDGMDWVSRRGLIEIARDADRVDPVDQVRP